MSGGKKQNIRVFATGDGCMKMIFHGYVQNRCFSETICFAFFSLSHRGGPDYIRPHKSYAQVRVLKKKSTAHTCRRLRRVNRIGRVYKNLEKNPKLFFRFALETCVCALYLVRRSRFQADQFYISYTPFFFFLHF